MATQSPQKCPEDSETWDLIEIFPEDHLLRIEPSCAYEGLARTAAWMLLERMGYTKQESAELLGMESIPWTPRETVQGYSNFQGPQEIELQMEWPAHPRFYFWQLDREGQAGTVISLRGCFESPPSLLCVLALDRPPGSAVGVLDEHHFASHYADQPASRSFFLVEYEGAGLWNLLGQVTDQITDLEDLGLARIESDKITNRLGTVPWDRSWLYRNFGLVLKPLPTDWRLYTLDEISLQNISEELNRFTSAHLEEDDD